jgi:antagonist of KipI
MRQALQQRALVVLRPGMLTTVQDLGRWGHQASGVPVAGPMDMYSHRLANQLVGNSEAAAALEITLIGPELQARGDLLCAVAGADFRVLVGGHHVQHTGVFRVPAGTTIRFGERQAGARASLAVRGGIVVPSVLGSRSTSILSRMGPFDGRALAPGDLLPIGEERRFDDPVASAYPMAMPRRGARLRAIPGPHDAMFTSEAMETFFSSRYHVTPSSNRMGYRLEGPALTHMGAADILSDATPVGSIQVPASGQPILLMADRQTTGGYPKIATVITADLPIAGQLAPGDWVEFTPCTRAAAIDALHLQERRLTGRTR